MGWWTRNLPEGERDEEAGLPDRFGKRRSEASSAVPAVESVVTNLRSSAPYTGEAPRLVRHGVSWEDSSRQWVAHFDASGGRIELLGGFDTEAEARDAFARRSEHGVWHDGAAWVARIRQARPAIHCRTPKSKIQEVAY